MSAARKLRPAPVPDGDEAGPDDTGEATGAGAGAGAGPAAGAAAGAAAAAAAVAGAAEVAAAGAAAALAGRRAPAEPVGGLPAPPPVPAAAAALSRRSPTGLRAPPRWWWWCGWCRRSFSPLPSAPTVTHPSSAADILAGAVVVVCRWVVCGTVCVVGGNRVALPPATIAAATASATPAPATTAACVPGVLCVEREVSGEDGGAGWGSGEWSGV